MNYRRLGKSMLVVLQIFGILALILLGIGVLSFIFWGLSLISPWLTLAALILLFFFGSTALIYSDGDGL